MLTCFLFGSLLAVAVKAAGTASGIFYQVHYVVTFLFRGYRGLYYVRHGLNPDEFNVKWNTMQCWCPWGVYVIRDRNIQEHPVPESAVTGRVENY